MSLENTGKHESVIKVYFNKILSSTTICISIDIAQVDGLFHTRSKLLPSKRKDDNDNAGSNKTQRIVLEVN